MEPLSGFLIIISSLFASSLSAILSCLVRLCLVVGSGLSVDVTTSSLLASSAFSNATGSSSCVLTLALSGGGFLNSNGSPSGLVGLGGSLSVLYCFLILVAKVLRSCRISCISALGAVGTNDRSNFCDLVRQVDNV